jgi:hypothetical protein
LSKCAKPTIGYQTIQPGRTLEKVNADFRFTDHLCISDYQRRPGMPDFDYCLDIIFNSFA